MIIIVYIYTCITFFYIQDKSYDFGVNAYDSDIVGENNCLTMYQCFVNLLNNGLRSDGGIGDSTKVIHYLDLTEDYYVKMVHDSSFHILVKVIMLNVLFGIIIDTFAGLRDARSKNQFDMVNICFICNQEKLIFEKYNAANGGFQGHITNDHNLW